jgi:hypothetical protein
MQQAIDATLSETTRPSVLFRPSLSIDGNMYCALYGADLMCGVAGFGATPSEAMYDFDANFNKTRPPLSETAMIEYEAYETLQHRNQRLAKELSARDKRIAELEARVQVDGLVKYGDGYHDGQDSRDKRITELEAENADLRRIIGRELADSAREHAHLMTDGDKGYAHEAWVNELVRLAAEYRRVSRSLPGTWSQEANALLGHAYNKGNEP